MSLTEQDASDRLRALGWGWTLTAGYPQMLGPRIPTPAEREFIVELEAHGWKQAPDGRGVLLERRP